MTRDNAHDNAHDKAHDDRTPGGLVHSYQAYDPKNFPSPLAERPDVNSAAFEHLLEYGSLRDLTDEELARAVKIDPSMIPGLGPSLDSLIAMLEERKKRILETYNPAPAAKEAQREFNAAAREADPPSKDAGDFARAVRSQQLADLERLWYRQKNERSPFSLELMDLMERLGASYQIDELIAKRTFTGREALNVPKAIAIKHELDTIDELLRQLREALENAQIGVIDLDELSQFADPEQVENLNELQKQIEELLQAEAERQGFEKSADGYRLTPKAYALFQGRVLSEIFKELEASRSGRHAVPAVGEGAIETQRTRGFEFGDSPSHLDISQSVLNAAARARQVPVRLRADDLVVHETRVNPKCATSVLMDMSGSMRHGGQYVNVKRMALALDALIRREYPGDHLSFIEMYTLAKLRRSSEIVSLMPKPVSIGNPVVRLKADMSDPNVSESRLPQHFTNIQRSLSLARRILSAQDTPNRQIALITDGLPTAHDEGPTLYMLYPPDPRTEEATMREARACARDGIVINLFLLPSWSQSSEDIQFAHKLAEVTRGRVFFTAGRDLDRFVLWDYVARRRRIIA